jgi:hypothetical protein
MRLYDVPSEIASFEVEIEANAGEITPELEERWKAFVAAGKDKIEAAAMVITTLKAQAEACEAEAERLQSRAESLAKNVERLKELTIGAVDAMGGKVKTSLFTIWTQDSASSISVEVKPGTDLAEMAEFLPGFVRTKRELDKKAILDRIKSDPTFTPAECLVIDQKPGTHYLRIK